MLPSRVEAQAGGSKSVKNTRPELCASVTFLRPQTLFSSWGVGQNVELIWNGKMFSGKKELGA
jgi:hypothetical protein